ncbi:hypothetical protein NE237_008656 [Protea cynaroides]|uniref:Exostosin GT47 domain-containing protein n=1 Tax=Protea cynaroides TaxID=273540 RepID=A0A9Q0KWA3_9MAGN|nr:hypothetical protein NE237_008656 [Protea cynaroides]
MFRPSIILDDFSCSRVQNSFGRSFLIPISLALVTSLFILSYISATSKLFVHFQPTHFLLKQSLESLEISPPTLQTIHPSVHSPHGSASNVLKSNEAGKGSERPQNPLSLGTQWPVGSKPMEKAKEVKFNAIQVMCSSSYYLSGYVAHKDASLPQIWPRQGDPPNLYSSRRNKLAFFAGSMNSPVRQKVLEVWKNDSDISVHPSHINTEYSAELLRSKFCLQVKGFEVNTARIGDAIYYGCVPVVIANHYVLPFADILNWKSFSIIVTTLDIPLLKKILLEISLDQYLTMQRNVLEVRKHFQWHVSPIDYDAFYMVMYELWLRRGSVRVPLSGWVEPS